MSATRLKLVKTAAACEALGVSRTTFWRHWDAVFTDPRPAAERVHGTARKVYDDELAVAVERGGGAAARLAVLHLRGLLKRK